MRRLINIRQQRALGSKTSVFTHEHELGESNADRARKLRRSRLAQGNFPSLIPETLLGMDQERDLRPKSTRLAEARRVLPPTSRAFPRNLTHDSPVSVFQLNLGLYCNQACKHCHVEASPRRKKDQMSMQCIDHCLQVISNSKSITCVDITGGAPELHEGFTHLVQSLRGMNPKLDIIDRCNLTVLTEPGQEALGEFLRDNRVHVVASLPCYGEKNVDLQRGHGVFQRSIQALIRLNQLGYGSSSSQKGALQLDLVYNPLGAFLPPDQSLLEAQYKEKLDADFGITFNRLFCLTNMPIKRFADFLHHRGELEQYMQLLVDNYNPETLNTLMCKNTLSVRHDGVLFDCDFNQQLGLEMLQKRTIFDLKSTDELTGSEICTEAHCFGCTAGKGSSCQGEVL